MWVVPLRAGQLRERGVVGKGPLEELVGDLVELGPGDEEFDVNAGALVEDGEDPEAEWENQC